MRSWWSYRLKVQVCVRLIVGIAFSNPAEIMNIRPVCVMCFVGSGLCDRLITRSEESDSCDMQL